MLSERRGRYWGKGGARDSAYKTEARRQKVLSRKACMEQCLEALGDPREQMSLEEKKKLGLFYFFTQVPPFLLATALFEHPFPEAARVVQDSGS